IANYHRTVNSGSGRRLFLRSANQYSRPYAMRAIKCARSPKNMPYPVGTLGKLSQPINAKTNPMATTAPTTAERHDQYGFKASSVGTTLISISNFAQARGKATKSVKSR